MTDPGELFLQGYFGAANLRQQTMTRQAEASNFSAKMAFDQQKLAQEAQQEANRQNFEKMRLDQEAKISQRQQDAQDFSHNLVLQKGVSEGQFDTLDAGEAPPDKISQSVYSAAHPDVTFGPSGQAFKTVTPDEQNTREMAKAQANAKVQQGVLSDKITDFKKRFGPVPKDLDAGLSLLDAYGPHAAPVIDNWQKAQATGQQPGKQSSDEWFTQNVLQAGQNHLLKSIQADHTDPKTGKFNVDAAMDNPKYNQGMKPLISAYHDAKAAGAMVTQGAANQRDTQDNQDYFEYKNAVGSALNKYPANQKLKPEDVQKITDQAYQELASKRMQSGGKLPDRKVIGATNAELLRTHPKLTGLAATLDSMGNIQIPTAIPR